MQITIFSLFMAVMWSSVIILIQYIFIKKRYFIMMFGISSVLLLYIFSMVRMLMPVEFLFTKEIVNVYLWNKFYTYLCINEINFIGETFTRVDFLLWIWLAGTVLLSMLFIIKYVNTISKINNFETLYNGQADIVLEKVVDTLGKQVNVRVVTSPMIKSPLGIGILKKTVLLPAQNYSEEDLFYILLHEITHFLNKDIPFKILIQFFCYIFWWNPIVYLLRKDLEQVLEIKCDLAVIANMDKKKKISYLSTIVHIIKGQESCGSPYGFESVSIIGGNSGANLIERFRIVSNDKKGMDRLSIKILWYVSFFCIILASYSFIIQSEYSAPEKEIVTDDNTFEIKEDNSFIIQRSDGKYLLIHESGYEQIIDKEVAKEMVEEGFDVRSGK
ncbi:M56 family metallopeptidase [Faecalicatena contorta]|uniref:Signal transducer regulating beta-lactamase production, contains metallopeptidase domain n=1 Tax=Faecalicatena contorta TaxID=39482 RepID=A0A316AIK2_9FIRM|nr:M56 family metallopeptidase [Faecalicatena contorta]PWJ49767.1 beta-lactamase regulating signal transducer with metallopeptidase domain [Faecalicatena contorta]SUQ14485.1 Signal transducer regulating beta-lactamase production, contains metallopeptidase domain [Faecalicatena contorta]